jgi:hypothetical protein
MLKRWVIAIRVHRQAARFELTLSSVTKSRWLVASLSTRIRRFVTRARAIVGRRRWTPKRESLVGKRCFVAEHMHMHVNRMIRSAQRAHEVVIYDYLFRIYEGQLARAGKADRPSRRSQGCCRLTNRILPRAFSDAPTPDVPILDGQETASPLYTAQRAA